MNTVCQVCGVGNNPEDLILCTICKNAAQHSYCCGFHKIPKKDENVVWSCEQCVPIIIRKIDPSSAPNATRTGTSSHRLDKSVTHRLLQKPRHLADYASMPYLTGYYGSLIEHADHPFTTSRTEWEHLTAQTESNLNAVAMDLSLRLVAVAKARIGSKSNTKLEGLTQERNELAERVLHLEGKMKECHERMAAWQAAFEGLESQYTTLEIDHRNCMSNYKLLENSFNELKLAHGNCDGRYKTLLKEYADSEEVHRKRSATAAVEWKRMKIGYFHNGMKHEREMCNLVYPSLLNMIVPRSEAEWERWRKYGTPVKHPLIGALISEFPGHYYLD